MENERKIKDGKTKKLKILKKIGVGPPLGPPPPIFFQNLQKFRFFSPNFSLIFPYFSGIFRRKGYPQSGALTPKARGQRTNRTPEREKTKKIVTIAIEIPRNFYEIPRHFTKIP